MIDEAKPSLVCLPPLACFGCGAVENIHIEPSMTRYPWNGMGTDPNRDLPLCEWCGKDYREHWQERWDDYYAGLL